MSHALISAMFILIPYVWKLWRESRKPSSWARYRKVPK